MENQTNSLDRTALNETIAAVATPAGQSGLAVIRVSGPAAAQVGDLLFEPAAARFGRVSEMKGYTCAPGYWLSSSRPRQRLDQVVITRFRRPHSFTGEEVVEIACHGGYAVKKLILDSILALGVRAAGPGEFTKRAFMNGKIDLAQAEAVMDLISSEARLQAKAAINQLSGAVSDKIKAARNDIYTLLARTELILEFPEHDETDENLLDLKNMIQKVISSLQALVDSYSQGRILSEGLNVVIAGKPNAGKSTLLNKLAGYDRAIVTEIPGTTRDTVSETVDIDGLPVHIIDTAGLRNSEDPIEKIGVDRSRQAMLKADLLVWMVSPPLSELGEVLAEIQRTESYEIPLVLICGKDDLEESALIKQQMLKNFPHLEIIAFSAVSGEGLDSIRRTIYQIYQQKGSSASEAIMLTNSRHRDAAGHAVERLREAYRTLESGLTLDLTSMLLRSSAESLAEITGDVVSEEIVDAVFSRFCVGK